VRTSGAGRAIVDRINREGRAVLGHRTRPPGRVTAGAGPRARSPDCQARKHRLAENAFDFRVLIRDAEHLPNYERA